MSITQKLENGYKNIIENIKKMANGIEKNMAIGSLVHDLGKRSIKPIAREINSCFRTVKKCFVLFKEKYNMLGTGGLYPLTLVT